MKKLSTTWRHQKALPENSALPSKQNEQILSNLGRRRLGRLPITSASGTVKPSLTINSETVATASCTTDDGFNGDIPSSFLSTFSASVDNDLIKELEKVETALRNGIYKLPTKPDSFSASRYDFPKEEVNIMGLKPISDIADSKVAGKRKYFKASASHTSRVHTTTISGKPSVVHNLKAALNSAASPTSSPTDKRSKHSTATCKFQNLSNNRTSSSCSKNKSLTCTSPPKLSAPRRNCNKDESSETGNTVDQNDVSSSSKDILNGSDSFNFSDISFSPICSPLGGDIDVVDVSKDESPLVKQSVCKELLRNGIHHSKKTNASSQKRQLAEHYNILKPDTGASCALIMEAGKFKPSVLSQKRSSQSHILSPVVTMKKGRTSQNKIQLNGVKIAIPLQDQANTSCNGYKDNNQQLLVACESFNDCDNDQTGRRTKLRSATCVGQQQDLKSGGHDNHNVSDLKGSRERDSEGITPERSRNCQIDQGNLSSNVLQESSFGSASLTADKRQLSSWGLPEPVLEAYKNQGVQTMFEWQADCLLTGNVLDGGNLVYSAPTSAGKTLVAELLILKRVLESRKKALFILPFVSVVREKMYSLQQLFQNAGIRVGGYMGSHSPPGGFKRVHIAVCTIEKGNGLINRLMEEGKLGELGAVVIDELHMVGDSHRGYLLELMLTKLAYIVQRTKDGTSDCQVQIIGMSATLPNLSLLAKWLNASLYCTDFRPVPLTEYIKIDSKILNGQLIIEREIPALLMSPEDADHVVALCIETVSHGHGVLVFCPTKNWCEKLCEAVARRFYTLQSQDRTAGNRRDGVSGNTLVGIVKINLDRSSLMETVEQLRRSPVGLDPMLGKCVLNGVAYHHAGLTFDERDIIEGAFRQGHLKVVVATSTLSSGVNLPARRVIIRTPLFYGKVIDTLTYKQMVGRAGRKGIDTEGESILICKSHEKNVGKKLMESELPPVESCLHFNADEGLSGSLKRAILEVVVSGVATSPADVSAYVNCTLLSASLSEESQNNVKTALAESCIKFLQENEFVAVNVTHNEDGTESRKFYPTQLGSAILASSLSPDEGLLVFAELQKAQRALVLDTELHIIYLVTPVYSSDVSASIDWYNYHHQWETLTPADHRVADLVGVSESFIARAIQGRINGKTEAQRKALAIHKRFYTALVLNCLVQESPLMEVAARFNCNKGQLQSLQQSASTFAGMITVFCGRLGWHSLELILSQFHKRLSFGVQQELVDLVRISTLNASSARMLFNAGYHTVTDVARAESADVENLFKNTVPFQSEKRQDGETDWELKERRRARCIWLTGRKGVTELDAALAIIEEAKLIVQGDLGVGSIAWEAKDKHEENSVADDSEDPEESAVSEGHLEMSRALKKDERSVTSDSLKLHGLKVKGNTTVKGTAVECEVSLNRIGIAVAKQENGTRQIVLNRSYDKIAVADLSQRNSSNIRMNSSNGSFRKSRNLTFCHAKGKERSFFGQIVVSPPVGVRNLVNNSVRSSKSNISACDNIRCEDSDKTAQSEIMSDGRTLHNKVHDLTVAESINNQGETLIGKDNCVVPSLSTESSTTTTTGATITSHLAKESINNNSKLCTVSRVIPVQDSEQGEVNNSSGLCISFSESFEIDTQTANMINPDGQDIEQNQQTTTREFSCGSPSTSKYRFSGPVPGMNVCQDLQSPVSAFESILQTDNMTKIDTNHGSKIASPDPFMDSMSEAWLFDYENVELNTPQRKSTSNKSSENVHERFSEPLFDSPEVSQQKLDRSDESTPKRTVTKSVHYLKFSPDNLVEEDTVVELTTDIHNCERLSESFTLVQSLKDSIVNPKHKTIMKYCDGEELCSSLIAASNYEHLMCLDDGMLEEISSQPNQLNYSCADLQIIDNVDRNNILTDWKDKNLQNIVSTSSREIVVKDKKSVQKDSKGDLDLFKSKDFIPDALLGTQDEDYSYLCLSSQSSNKQPVSRLRNIVSIPQSSTPFTNINVRGQTHKLASPGKNASRGQTTVKSVLNEHVTDENFIMCRQNKICQPKTADISGSDENLIMCRQNKICQPKTADISGSDENLIMCRQNKICQQKTADISGSDENLIMCRQDELCQQKAADISGSDENLIMCRQDELCQQKAADISGSDENLIMCRQNELCQQKAADISVSDEFFSGSFSSSLMDRVMKECDDITEERCKKITTNIHNINCCTAFVISSEAGNEVCSKGCQHDLQDAQLSPIKSPTDPLSNNSSRNDGSDCVPPTPPDETSSAASPFRMSFYSPLQPKASAASKSILTPKREIPKQLRDKEAKNDFTAIKDRNTQNAASTNHFIAAKQVFDCHSSDNCSTNLDLAEPSCSSLLKYDQAQRRKKHNIVSTNVVSTRSTGENIPAESSFNEHSLSASQPPSQPSFTIVDVCADRRLFETFIAEVKSKQYIALSVACEKKPPETKQGVSSTIGGKFLRKRTSPPGSKSKMAAGIPVPDSEAFIVGVAISWENRDSYFVSLVPADGVPLPSKPDLGDGLSELPLTLEERIKALAEVLGSKPGSNEKTVAAYDFKATFVCLAKALGLSLSHCEDPCVANWLREPCAKLKNLHQMVVSHCPEELGLLDAVGGGTGYHSMGSDIKSRVDGRLRACTESVLTQKLMSRFHTLLADEHLLTAFTNVEMPAIVTLARMELNGFGISEPEIEQQKTLLTTKLNMLEEQAYKMAGHVFSLTSLTDVATILYQELKLPVNGDPTLVPHLPTYGRQGKRAPIGGTGKEILEKLQKFHPLPAVILEWRRLSSALTKSLFALNRSARPCPHLGMVRVYGDCHIFTSTGRVSMAEPNLQNIPKDFAINLPYFSGEVENAAASSNGKSHNISTRISALEGDKDGAKYVQLKYAASTPVSMRKMFVPFRGGIILAADYSQLELRIIAHLSGDSKLASILNTPDGDVFKIIAAQIKGLDIPEVSSEHRQQAKQVCYGMLYGIGTKALAEQLGMDEKDADVFMETFKSRYLGVRKYLQSTVEFCQKNGYVKTLFNRRRYLPSIKDGNPGARAQAERQAVNSTIQGSAADLVKVAMTNIDRKLMDLFPDTQKCHSQSRLDKDLSDRRNNKIPPVNGAYLVLQLHDELIYEVSADHVLEVARLVKHHMETAVKLSICMPVNIKVGPSWGELAEFEFQT